MTLNEALRKRVNELIVEKNINLTTLCLNSGLTPSTMFDFIYGNTKCPKVVTIQKICYGAEITLKDFFDREYFKNLEE